MLGTKCKTTGTVLLMFLMSVASVRLINAHGLKRVPAIQERLGVQLVYHRRLSELHQPGTVSLKNGCGTIKALCGNFIISSNPAADAKRQKLGNTTHGSAC